MLTPAEAEEQIARHLPCLPIESLPVSQCAGSVLRENVYAERDHPPFDRVAMDGIAVDSAAVAGGRRTFRIQATQAAGDPPLTLASPEPLHRDHDRRDAAGRLRRRGAGGEDPRRATARPRLQPDVAASPRPEHPRARQRSARRARCCWRPAARLEAPDVATAAGAGMARLRVSQQPAFMVVSTGNELVEPGDPIETWQLRRSNAYGLVAALRRRGFLRVADDHLPDDAAVLPERLREHLQSYDVLILSGGVSMGKFDLVPMALEACGVQAGVPQGGAAPRQALLVRHGADRHGGVRPARQSGLHAGVPGALCHPGDRPGHGRARTAQRREDRAGRCGHAWHRRWPDSCR